MIASHTLHALELKRRQLVQAIARYEQLLVQARVDLANVAAVIPVFEVKEGPQAPAYGDIRRLYNPPALQLSR